MSVRVWAGQRAQVLLRAVSTGVAGLTCLKQLRRVYHSSNNGSQAKYILT